MASDYARHCPKPQAKEHATYTLIAATPLPSSAENPARTEVPALIESRG